ncbi:cob(I)alamin adenosyltransferase/cobinamide ATP-dependent adenosyltransferase [Desulfosarcina alkanivorans]|uniref:corrinoid adenosyltransferase n=1 Tax=Desulfosarcina alkanivorans TaxID=571177 RepID=A0A5K7YWC8_9BACT|nr:cob(I)yrinic acid a,c-diamide adenosyltransferase [Desulfosarcina alkanivorans]BBO72293.1 cob(I)alamin adenosyltransferase/cobinamide ATP-dependent adenosyltransferase [Desulfosarcina alkanivorans]
MAFKNGYTQIYTGDGKGKTTASLGLALRAAGAGLKVYIAQFIKSGDYSEIRALARFADRITVEQFGLGRFIKGKPAPEDVAAAQKGLAAVRSALASGRYKVVIMEEGNVAALCGLFPVDAILEIMAQKPGDVELVVTGRGADARVIDRADLVTEMKAVKHYYQAGVAARTGIEK